MFFGSEVQVPWVEGSCCVVLGFMFCGLGFMFSGFRFLGLWILGLDFWCHILVPVEVHYRWVISSEFPSKLP